MERGIYLSRVGSEPWGFRLVGGVDYGMPLTVAKVQQYSPADQGGLVQGDVLTSIDGIPTANMTHRESGLVLAEAGQSLSLVVTDGGLYDPVLDDTELLYEAIDQDDFDQPSLPTEVQFEPKQFLDQEFCLTLPDIGINLPQCDKNIGTRLENIEELGPTPNLLQEFNVSRSITASPLNVQNRASTPFRPFSTEPIEAVPPLEDPIILNPDYQDVFAKFIEEDFLPKTKFKLPISEQYDPDGNGRKKEEKSVIEAVCEKKEIQKHVCVIKDMKEQIKREEAKSMETMKKEIDLDKIELTASSIVEESLEKALTVTEEIKKEINDELKSSVVSSELSLTENKKTFKTENQKVKFDSNKNSVKEVKELIDKTTDEILNANLVKADIAKVAEQLEKSDQGKQKVEERKLSTKQEISETIETGSVNNISPIYEKEVKDKNMKKNVVEKKDLKTKSVDVKVKLKDLEQDVKQNVQASIKNGKTESTSSKASNTKSSSKFQAEQRSYTIGLQTIPNIRGSIQYSSSHFDLLLRTFFVHLTDVMVALSRFILTEHALKSELFEENEKVTTKTREKKAEDVDVQDTGVEIEKRAEELSVNDSTTLLGQKTINDRKISQNATVNERKERIDENIKVAALAKEDNLSNLEVEEIFDKRMLSGAEMSQLSEKKSEELTHRMSAVITEFQTKAGIEESSPEARERSKSRSRAETQITEEQFAAKTSSVTESQKTVKDSSYELNETKSTKTIGTNTYIAVVEAHVYTNKDAILADNIKEFSENASFPSADETKTAAEVNEAFSTEKVAIDNIEVSKTEVEPFVPTIDFVYKDTVPIVDIKIKKEADKTREVVQRQDLKVLDQTARKIQGLRRQQLVLRKAELEKNAIKTEVIKQTIKPVLTQELKAVTEIKSSIDVNELVSIKEQSTAKQLITDVQEVKPLADTEKEDVKQELLIKVDETTACKKETFAAENAVSETSKSAGITIKEEISEVNFAIKNEMEESVSIAHVKSIKEKGSIETIEAEDRKVSVEESNKHFIKTKSAATLSTNNEVAIPEASVKMDVESEKKEFLNEKSKSITFTDKEISILQRDTSEVYQPSETNETNNTEILSQTIEQESSFVATSTETKREGLKLEGLRTDFSQTIDRQTSNNSNENNNIDTPTPSTVPPITPLTDEYIFKLQIPRPKSPEIPIPRDCTPSDSEDEDPHIVKKNLIPHIETKIEEGIVYDPPLASPPGNKVTPVYTKPGLRGGADRKEIPKEEIIEIERKSSLLTSAIDETIKSIEAYKEEVGIDKKEASRTKETFPLQNGERSNGVIYNGFGKVVETKVFDNIGEHEMDSENTKSTVVTNVNNFESNVSDEMKIESTETKVVVKAIIPDCTFKTEFVAKKDPLEGYRPIQFNPEEIQSIKRDLKSVYLTNGNGQMNGHQESKQMYKTETGELLGTHQGIVDGLEEAVVDSEFAKELGKPGMTEEKIAELISGESEMLREAHVMGLSRVLTAHMSRPDDSSVDFKKIKPIIESLKDSEVLKALNDEMIKSKEEKKKEERKWTTFLQKPQRPTPKVVNGYHGYVDVMEEVKEPYRVKIVKQPKPKVAPDYKPENFNTGLLPWEERALREPTPPPVTAEDPILVPEEAPEILEAVDPLPESEVPDLEDSGIPLSLPKEETPPPEEINNEDQEELDLDLEEVIEETENIVQENLVKEMDKGNLAEQLMMSVQNMIDPNASLEQQLSQMRAQLAALAQLPCVIQQSLELVTKQLGHLSQMEASQTKEVHEDMSEETQNEEIIQKEQEQEAQNEEEVIKNGEAVEEVQAKPTITAEENERMRREEEEMLEEQRRLEKQKKDAMEQARLEHESRLIKQRPTPRVGKPKPVFGPPAPVERPVVLPGGRKWRNEKDAYNEQFIAETLTAQAEIIQGKAKGFPYESVLLPYDRRINFMKYEKPPVSLDHLQNSDTYKLVHNMEGPLRRTDMLTPVIAEADYREKCRSISPCVGRMNKEEHLDIPQQVQP